MWILSLRLNSLGVSRLGPSWIGLLGVLALLGCDPDPEPTLAEDIFAPLGAIRPSASDTERATFAAGQAVAEHRFTAEEGLGPHFNVSFCGACHEKPTFGGGAARYRNFLLARQTLPDGTSAELAVNGVEPQFDLSTGRRASDPATDLWAGRNPIPFFGIGLLAEIPEEEILRRVDPDDRDGDGIRGVANFDRGFVGRFGVKAQTVSIEGFIRGPLFNHAGITSAPLSYSARAALPVPSPTAIRSFTSALTADVQVTTQGQAAAPEEPIFDDDEVPDPELAEADLFDLVSWAMLLAAPEPEPPTPESEAGRELFDASGCESCHVEALAGPRGLIPAFTDLLLHDMGEALADGVQMGLATGSQFRTQPLWGVVASGPYLHDGRADSLDEAIRLHGGEASTARDAYVALRDDERGLILEFLASLGGRDQRSAGLLPPDTSFAPGELGGPAAGASEDERDAFAAGLALFDHDFGLDAGVGPRFNGDACRACHFEPVVGGAGPIDVDVTRLGVVSGVGAPEIPSGGSVLHRHATAATRPEPPTITTEERIVVELRQTPALFGLGLLEQVPAALLEGFADPDDLDGDGVRGRLAWLEDGRLGRFGWKASIPSLAEFTRDAASTELGLSVPEVSGMRFGRTSDEDAQADPELDVATLDALTAYMQSLAPPPGDRDAAGELLFAAVGCASCHRELALADGTPVRAYTDLLLHDVARSDYEGVPEGAASHREFRTPPLWGVGLSGPWMHDGLAFTLEEAIAAHAGEASASALAFAALSAEERATLLGFLEQM